MILGRAAETSAWRLGYRPGLDGLRGVAVLLVVGAHLTTGAYPHPRPLFGALRHGGGGLVGVQLFFVLSGFLITSLLLRERRDCGRVDLRAFYLRRARRLLPALVVVCLVYLTISMVFSPEGYHDAIGSVLRSLLYLEDFGRVAPIAGNGMLGHTWSLAVEEQFYLVWPIVLITGATLWGRRAVAVAAVAVILATVVGRALMADGTLEYTVLRWDALAMGCLLATFPTWRPSRPIVASSAALYAILALFLPADISQTVYLGTAAAGGVLVMAAIDARRWLTAPLLVHIGRVSYGLYLWHVLVMRAGWHPAITIPVFVAAAELSWRYVEQPFLRRQRSRGSGGPERDAPDEQVDIRCESLLFEATVRT